jgi:hypothetical protein
MFGGPYLSDKERHDDVFNVEIFISDVLDHTVSLDHTMQQKINEPYFDEASAPTTGGIR